MENAKNGAPGAPSANKGLETSSLSRLAAPLPVPASGTPRILSVMELADRNSHHAKVSGIHAMTTDPIKDRRFTRFNLMAT